MKRTITALLALATALPIAASTVAAASATPPPAASTRSTSDALTGYVQRVSPVTTAASGTQVRAEVRCPNGTKVVGGGAVLADTGLDMSLHTSVPVFDGQRWRVAVNNTGRLDSSFRAYAVCAGGISNYQVIEGIGVDNPAGTQVTARAFCPAGTVPLGGGAAPIEAFTSISINSSVPLDDGWQVTVNASGADDDFVLMDVVCGTRPAGYQQVVGATSVLKPFGQGQAAVACPEGTVVLGGGARSSSRSSSVSLNSSAPARARNWQAFENNDIATSSTLKATVVCAAASGT